MALRPKASAMVGLGAATLVYGIYSAALPPVADVRVADPNNEDINSAERLAAWSAAAAVAGISLITKDPTVFIMGGLMAVTLSWWHRHADQVSPLTHKAVGGAEGLTLTQESAPVDFGYEDSIPLAG